MCGRFDSMGLNVLSLSGQSTFPGARNSEYTLQSRPPVHRRTASIRRAFIVRARFARHAWGVAQVNQL